MNRAKFFTALRARNSGLFGTSLSQGQVEGVEVILDACQEHGASLEECAYILATPYGETGGKMQAKRENMNYSAKRIPQVFGPHRLQGKSLHALAGNPQLMANTVYGGEWGRKNLGNVKPTDGWDLRGAGFGQWTGRTNFGKLERQTGLKLLDDPSKLDDPRLQANLLVRWMFGGHATGAKLGDYVSNGRKDYLGARKVWGGVDAAKYAGHAAAFEKALRAGGYNSETPFVRPDVEPTAPAKPQTGILAAILRFIQSLSKGKEK